MFAAHVEPAWDVLAWRRMALAGLRARVAPEAVSWQGDAQGSLLALPPLEAQPVRDAQARLPAPLLQLASQVLCHRDPQRHGLLYRIAWRMRHGEPHLLDTVVDPDTHRAGALAQAVRRDSHKMKAFVRFRELPGHADTFVAWFEPEHWIVDRIAPFFARRFTGMRWSILTPYRSVRWDGTSLSFGDGALRANAPADDAGEALWRTYYAHIFNPARINPRMMRQEMPQKYWKHLPEAQLLPELLRDAGARTQAMVEREAVAPRRKIPAPAAAPTPPVDAGLERLRAAAHACRRCELWRDATQTVFGEGPRDARIVVVGEQPGDTEDLRGRPFVGPAGELFDRALAELGLDRARFYVTNAVKHFRFEMRGKVRLHRNPEVMHQQACHAWLEGELAAIRPEVVVCLGAIAARAVFGTRFRLMASRGTWHVQDDGSRGFATVHPAWVLRQPVGALREAAWRGFVDDLALLRERDRSALRT